MFNTPGISKKLSEGDTIHKCIVLPWELHRTASEITFLEDIRMKDLVSIALESEIELIEGQLDKTREETGLSPISFGLIPGESWVHTSVFLSKEIVAELRRISHYSKIAEKVIIADGIVRFIIKEYHDQYPDIVCRIEAYMSRGEA